MKKILSMLLSVILIVSAGAAYAAEAEYPQALQKALYSGSTVYTQPVTFSNIAAGTQYAARQSGGIANMYNKLTLWTLSEGTTVSVAASGDTEHGNVLSMVNSDDSQAAGTSELMLPAYDSNNPAIKSSGMYVISADFKLNNVNISGSRTLLSVKLTGKEAASQWYTLKVGEDGYLSVGSIITSQQISNTVKTSKQLSADEWYSITYIVDTLAGYRYLYVDGELISEDKTPYSVGGTLYTVSSVQPVDAGAAIWLDNIAFSYRTEASVTLSKSDYSYGDTAWLTNQTFEAYTEGSLKSAGGIYFSGSANAEWTVEKDSEHGNVLKVTTVNTSAPGVQIPGSAQNIKGKITLEMDIKFGNFDGMRKLISEKTAAGNWQTSGVYVNAGTGGLSKTNGGAAEFTFDADKWYSVKYILDTVTATEYLYVGNTEIWVRENASLGADFGYMLSTCGSTAGVVTYFDNIRMYYNAYTEETAQPSAVGDKAAFTASTDADTDLPIYLYNNEERIGELTASAAEGVLKNGTNSFTARVYNEAGECIGMSEPIVYNVGYSLAYSSGGNAVTSLDMAESEITAYGSTDNSCTVIAAIYNSDGSLEAVGIDGAGDYSITLGVPDDTTGCAMKVMYWNMSTMEPLFAAEILK